MSFADLLHRAGQLPGLTQTQKGILMALVIHSDIEGWSCPGQSTIQEYCSLKSPRPITAALKAMEGLGYVRVERRNGAISWYQLQLDKWPERRRRVPSTRQPPHQNQGSGSAQEKEQGYQQPPYQNQGFANRTDDSRSETPDRRSETPDSRSETPDRRSTEEYLRFKEDPKDTPRTPAAKSAPQQAGCVVPPQQKKQGMAEQAEQLVTMWLKEAISESRPPEKAELFYARYILHTYKDRAFGVVVRATELLRKKRFLGTTQSFCGLKTVMQQVSLNDLPEFTLPKADDPASISTPPSLAPTGGAPSVWSSAAGEGSPSLPRGEERAVNLGEPRQNDGPADRAGVGPGASAALSGPGWPSEVEPGGAIIIQPQTGSASPTPSPSWPTRPVGVFPGCQAPLIFPDQAARIEGLLGRLGRLPDVPAGLPVFKQAAIKGDRFTVRQALQAVLEGRAGFDGVEALASSVGRLEAQAVMLQVDAAPRRRANG